MGADRREVDRLGTDDSARRAGSGPTGYLVEGRQRSLPGCGLGLLHLVLHQEGSTQHDQNDEEGSEDRQDRVPARPATQARIRARPLHSHRREPYLDRRRVGKPPVWRGELVTQAAPLYCDWVPLTSSDEDIAFWQSCRLPWLLVVMP
jgi:hypothetical protein